MTDTTVKVFQSTDTGAPVFQSITTSKTLIDVLDACLINGYGTVTLDSLTIYGNVATAVKSTGHGLSMIGTTGPVIEISDATPIGLNGEWRVVSIPNSTTLTFTTTGIDDVVLTGVVCKRAGAGWAKLFSETYKAVYSRPTIGATAMLLRVDDTVSTSFANVTMYETMSSINTGVNGVTQYLGKTNGTGATAIPWFLYADKHLFHIFIGASGNASDCSSMMTFGDIIPYRGNDLFHCILRANPSAGAFFYSAHVLSADLYINRSYSQTGSYVTGKFFSHGVGSSFGYNKQAYPAPADNSFHAWPVELWEGTSIARGMLPGIWNPIHNRVDHGVIVTDIPQLPNRDLFVQNINTTYSLAIDITGPWR